MANHELTDANVNINISDDVVMGIVVNAAKEIEGVASIPSRISTDLKEIIGKKYSGKGVKLDIADKNVVVTIFINVDYGCKIQKVAEEVQTAIKTAVENMTGLTVTEVNVNVAAVIIHKEAKKK